jgi:hypothetical protein
VISRHSIAKKEEDCQGGGGGRFVT